MSQGGIYRDRVFVLLVLNMLLVIMGYGLVIFTGGEISTQLFWVKGSTLTLGVLNLFTVPYKSLQRIASCYKHYFLVSCLLLLTTLYAQDSLHSFLRTLLFVLPLAYTFFSISYLVQRYPFAIVEKHWLLALLFIYGIPIVSLFFVIRSTSYLNLYYINSDPYTSFLFVSNHYGWTSCIVFSSCISLSKYLATSRKLYKYLLGGISIVAIYLIIVSGNRTSWLVLFLLFVVGIYKGVSLTMIQKFLFSVLNVGLVIWLFAEPESAIYLRLNKTYVQWEYGESRFLRLEEAVEYLSNHWLVGMIGWGMFSPPNELSSNLHNSYAELFFGGGIFVFAYFLYSLVIEPVKSIYHTDTFLWPLIPVLIIPFFESNLTVGQFLFYPWFSTVFLEGVRR